MLVKFAKTYDITNIRLKLFIIYILNILDVVFTVVLLKTGYFREANFLMKNVVEDTVLAFLVKGTIPLILLVILSIRIKKANARQRFISNVAVTGCVIYYGIINVSHIIWTITYII